MGSSCFECNIGTFNSLHCNVCIIILNRILKFSACDLSPSSLKQPVLQHRKLQWNLDYSESRTRLRTDSDATWERGVSFGQAAGCGPLVTFLGKTFHPEHRLASQEVLASAQNFLPNGATGTTGFLLSHSWNSQQEASWVISSPVQLPCRSQQHHIEDQLYLKCHLEGTHLSKARSVFDWSSGFGARKQLTESSCS